MRRTLDKIGLCDLFHAKCSHDTQQTPTSKVGHHFQRLKATRSANSQHFYMIQNGKVIYTEQVEEVADEPNYEAALNALSNE